MIQIYKLLSMLYFKTLWFFNNGFEFCNYLTKILCQVSLQAIILFFLLMEGPSEHLHPPADSQLSVKVKLSGQILGWMIKFY